MKNVVKAIRNAVSSYNREKEKIQAAERRSREDSNVGLSEPEDNVQQQQPPAVSASQSTTNAVSSSTDVTELTQGGANTNNGGGGGEVKTLTAEIEPETLQQSDPQPPVTNQTITDVAARERTQVHILAN